MHVYLIIVCFLFEFKTSPYETAPTRAERFDPSEDDEEDSSITSFEKGSPAKTLIGLYENLHFIANLHPFCCFLQSNLNFQSLNH